MPDWIDAAEAARRLGIKPATLYAYVSRGVLTRRHDENGRRSLFDAADIDRLARRGRPRHPQPELVIESAITALGVDRPHYRGVDALRLAESTPFEAVAAWLWTATPPVPRTPPDSASDAASGEAAPWVGEPAAVGAAIHTQRSLPPDLLPLDRLQVITTVLGAADSLRFHLDPDSVIATAKRLIAGLVDALPKLCPPTGPTIPHRLWAALSPAPPTQEHLDTLRTAMVLLADHELAASTLAARVAASARADPYAVVQTGLGVLGGPLHGGASHAAERLLADLPAPGAAPRVIAERVRRGERIPGFGHSVYKNGDARGTHLLDQVLAAHPQDAPRLTALVAEVRRRRLPAPNIDFALAALTVTAGLAPGSGEAIFAVSRAAGWLAHAMEEYAHGTLLRLRASYVGPPPH
ncbi:citrate synthase [Nonomuraea sp. NBC_01738]|uniref:citrate synthase n=1 Tax=Nonomuraea sp. NBC_01738 TaxID=2976003 RepID=UPI002E167AEE|nr:citrate synthase [Nonomuraea sp. NBC_01738]